MLNLLTVNGQGDLEVLKGEHENASSMTKRWFSLVQEISFVSSELPDNWTLVVSNREHQRRIYQRARNNLKRMLAKIQVGSKVRVYGGLKPYDSIKRKLFVTKDGNAVQRNILDLWDLIRFRIVATDLETLLRVGIAIWNMRFENVIRCRNYYFYPRGDMEDGYRALHFELKDRYGAMVEVQLMTRYREAVCLVDHAPRFKRSVPYVEGEEDWLNRLSYSANILEHDNNQMRDLLSIILDSGSGP